MLRCSTPFTMHAIMTRPALGVESDLGVRRGGPGYNPCWMRWAEALWGTNSAAEAEATRTGSTPELIDQFVDE